MVKKKHAGRPRVVYLSSTERGRHLLDHLRNLDCDIVFADTESKRYKDFKDFPPYDLGISYMYTWRIPSSEFDVPYRWVNVHPGPLPEFRGRNLGWNAINSGAKTFGATIHYMDADFDTGEVIEVDRFPIDSYDTAGDIVERAHIACEGLIKKWAPRLFMGKVPSTPQTVGSYYKKTKIDNEILLNEEQKRMIRAVTVHPKFHASVTIGGRKYSIIPDEPSVNMENKLGKNT